MACKSIKIKISHRSWEWFQWKRARLWHDMMQTPTWVIETPFNEGIDIHRGVNDSESSMILKSCLVCKSDYSDRDWGNQIRVGVGSCWLTAICQTSNKRGSGIKEYQTGINGCDEFPGFHHLVPLLIHVCMPREVREMVGFDLEISTTFGRRLRPEKQLPPIAWNSMAMSIVDWTVTLSWISFSVSLLSPSLISLLNLFLFTPILISTIVPSSLFLFPHKILDDAYRFPELLLLVDVMTVIKRNLTTHNCGALSFELDESDPSLSSSITVFFHHIQISHERLTLLVHRVMIQAIGRRRSRRRFGEPNDSCWIISLPHPWRISWMSTTASDFSSLFVSSWTNCDHHSLFLFPTLGLLYSLVYVSHQDNLIHFSSP